jgi:hypothetical protein
MIVYKRCHNAGALMTLWHLVMPQRFCIRCRPIYDASMQMHWLQCVLTNCSGCNMDCTAVVSVMQIAQLQYLQCLCALQLLSLHTDP